MIRKSILLSIIQMKVLRNIRYHYPGYHSFDSSLAYNIIDQIKKLEKDWNLNKLNVFIKENPEVKIDNSQSFYYQDSQTNPQYAIQGLLCHLAYEKGGVEGLKKLMNYKNIEQIYTDFFKVNEEKVNEFLKEEIKKYCQ